MQAIFDLCRISISAHIRILFFIGFLLLISGCASLSNYHTGRTIPDSEVMLVGGFNLNRIGYYSKNKLGFPDKDLEGKLINFIPTYSEGVNPEIGIGTGISPTWDIIAISTIPFDRNNTVMSHYELVNDVDGTSPFSMSV